MGVLDRLDDLWDAGFEVGRTSVNTVIDLVEAPFTEDEYEGFVGTVAGVTMDRGAETLVNLFGPEGVGGAAIGALPEPVRDVGREALEGLEWAYGYTSRGIATAMTAASLTEAEGQGNNPFAMIDGGLWRQAWHMTEDRSPGQAVALAMLTDDILDEEQVAHYEGTAFYNIMSGTWDAAFRLFLSPEVVAGYGVMLGRAGARRAAFNNYFDDGRGFGAFADDVGRMADDAAAPAGVGRAPEDVAFDDFAEMASRGQLHKATGRDFPGEATAASPYELGRINKYSEDDIAHFYNNRRRGDRLGYDEWVQDRAAYHAKAADDTALHDLAGRIREKYFPTHGDGDLVAYELARSYLGRHGFTGGRASICS